MMYIISTKRLHKLNYGILCLNMCYLTLLWWIEYTRKSVKYAVFGFLAHFQQNLDRDMRTLAPL